MICNTINEKYFGVKIGSSKGGPQLDHVYIYFLCDQFQFFLYEKKLGYTTAVVSLPPRQDLIMKTLRNRG